MTFVVVVRVLHCAPVCMLLHTDCLLAAGPLQIKPVFLGVHLWQADIAFQ